jgi:Flp pilus assembly pilin Flp
MQILRRLHHDDSGQDIVEYALIAGFISVVTIPLLQSVASSYQLAWSRVVNVVAGA